MSLLILDADGVFLDERPYWNVALGTALLRTDLAASVQDRWAELGRFAFDDLGLQQLAKARGYNSNWDLAAVLEQALDERELRADTRRLLEMGALHEALAGIKKSVEQSGEATMRTGWQPAWELPDDSPPAPCPAVVRKGPGAAPQEPFSQQVPAQPGGGTLSGLGMPLDESRRAAIKQTFQHVLTGEAGLDWTFPRSQLKESLAITCTAFGACCDAGFELRVCTGRPREEIETPLADLGLDGHFTGDRITSGHEVDRAEKLTGRHALSKPHWFAPVCAAIGFDAALRLLAGGTGSSLDTVVYVGDSPADFEAVRQARSRRISMAYIHMRSSATPAEQTELIARDPFTLGVIDSLRELAALLGKVST